MYCRQHFWQDQHVSFLIQCAHSCQALSMLWLWNTHFVFLCPYIHFRVCCPVSLNPPPPYQQVTLLADILSGIKPSMWNVIYSRTLQDSGLPIPALCFLSAACHLFAFHPRHSSLLHLCLMSSASRVATLPCRVPWSLGIITLMCALQPGTGYSCAL